MSETLRFSDVLARNVAVEWHEAVALVREVIDRLFERSGAQIVPELHQIELGPDGGIAISGGTRTDEPVRRLGQLLQAAIAQAETPVQLRLLVTQATAANPAFDSIREYASALGYFERPNRAAILQSLYARAAAAPAVPELHLMPTLDNMAPIEAPEPWARPRTKDARRSRRPALWLAVGAVLAVVAVAGFMKYGGAATGTGDVSAIARKASAAVETAVASGVAAVGARTGLRRSASPSVQTPVAAPVEVRSAPAPRPRRAAARNGGPAFASNALPHQMLELAPVAMVEKHGPAASQAVLAAPLTAAPPPGSKLEPDTTVYSAADGVRAPVSIRPQLPRDLPPNVSKDQVARIELVVLPDGTVGSVKLFGHRNVHDAMFLSAVKAWEFKPAVKNGLPVAYRTTVWVAFQ